MRKKGLHKINDGFGLPDNYFGELEDRIFTQTSLDSLIGKKDGFKTPPAYFENLENELFSRLEKDKVKVIPLNRRKKLRYSLLAVAAALTLVLGLKGVLFGGGSEFELTVSQVESYLDNSILNIGPYDLADLFDDQTLDEITMDSSYDQDALIEYLMENGEQAPILNFDE